MAKPGMRNQSRAWNNSRYEHRKNSSPPCTLYGLAGRQPYNAGGEIEADSAPATEGAPTIHVTYQDNRRVYMASYKGRIVVHTDFDAVQSQVAVWQADYDAEMAAKRAAAGF
jgi:hypothetical protein